MMTNKEIRIVFQPKDRGSFGGKIRFGVGSRSLHKYIGLKNSETVFTKGVKKALINPENKERIKFRKFRKFGIVDIYLK